MWLTLAALSLAQDGTLVPSDQTLVYFNAHSALQEDRPDEAVRLWLLRNTLREQSGTVSRYDGAFRSVVWVAMGEIDLCPDGFAPDSDGSGLWPIALYNHVVSDEPPAIGKPQHASRLKDGVQQRSISMHSSVGAREFADLTLRPVHCKARSRLHRHLSLTGHADESADLAILTHLLTESMDTLGPNVSGRAIVEARLFDLHLAQLDDPDRVEGSPAEQILAESVLWTPSEWMALSAERRRFLFDNARSHLSKDDALDALAIELVDAVALAGQGTQVGEWIARGPDHLDRRRIWSGATGELLLAMQPESGFRERSVLYLHRGVDAARRGDDAQAVRDLASALRHAPDSTQALSVASLCRRWLIAVLSEFTPTQDVVDHLMRQLPSHEVSNLVERLLWTSAVRGDRDGFDVLVQTQVLQRGTRDVVDLLTPLAHADGQAFAVQSAHLLQRHPRTGLTLLEQYVHAVECESGPIRARHVRYTFQPIADQLALMMAGEGSNTRRRATQHLWDRMAAVQLGVGELRNPPQRMRPTGPENIAHVGTVRVFPTDPLPWPFAATDARAPSVYEPLTARPLAWTQDDELVFGWRIHE